MAAVFAVGTAVDAPIYVMAALLVLLWAGLMLLSRRRS
jgi:hypothetical protein